MRCTFSGIPIRKHVSAQKPRVCSFAYLFHPFFKVSCEVTQDEGERFSHLEHQSDLLLSKSSNKSPPRPDFQIRPLDALCRTDFQIRPLDALCRTRTLDSWSSFENPGISSRYILDVLLDTGLLRSRQFCGLKLTAGHVARLTGRVNRGSLADEALTNRSGSEPGRYGISALRTR
jgi:hypothetical protein